MSPFTIALAIGVGGFVGALARFYIARAVGRAAGLEFSFLGTLTVNMTGCFAIGVLATIATRTHYFSPAVQQCLLTGLLGSLTTFSTFALDSLNLLQDGRTAAAVFNISVNLVAGLFLVWLGMLVTAPLVSASEL